MKTRVKKNEIEFDAEALVRRVEGFAAGIEPAQERTVKIPPPVKPISAREIRAIRAGLGFTQEQFAMLLNVPKVTAISWENGVRLLSVVMSHVAENDNQEGFFQENLRDSAQFFRDLSGIFQITDEVASISRADASLSQ